MKVKNPQSAIFASASRLFSFGNEDLYCAEKSGNAESHFLDCHSGSLGSSYKIPDFLTSLGTDPAFISGAANIINLDTASNFFTGSSDFTPDEIEVYLNYYLGCAVNSMDSCKTDGPGNTYKFPDSWVPFYRNDESNNFFVGQNPFQPIEIEIYLNDYNRES